MNVKNGQPCEPAVHVFAMRLAYRLVGLIEPCLRPEEVGEAARVVYAAIRQDLAALEESRRKKGGAA